MVAVFWPLNWFVPGLRTQLLFFPLWLGYCLTVDAIVARRKGDSMLTRSPARYAGLFLISIPAWWLFELLNWRTGNWIYQGAEFFTPLQFAVLASISFSTVIPAVFGTAELVGTLGWVQSIGRGPKIPPSRPVLLAFFAAGWLTLALLLVWPHTFFPFIWLSPFFILAPINAWLGSRLLVDDLADGDWRPVIALWIGVLVCGFFWEFWNYWSYPKWVYHVPYLGFLHVFEMPIVGYGGYLPFSLELFAIYEFLTRLLGIGAGDGFVRLARKGAGDRHVAGAEAGLSSPSRR
jgi:hypothetical protein